MSGKSIGVIARQLEALTTFDGPLNEGWAIFDVGGISVR